MTEMTSAVRDVSETVNLRDLRRRKVQSVRVITRSRFEALLKALGEEHGERSSGNEAKRIARLLEEVEKLGSAKLNLEHEKGLLEDERSRLQAELDQVVQAVGKRTGTKLTADDLRGMVEELKRLRLDTDKTRRSFDQLQKQAKAKIEERQARAESLEEARTRLEGELAETTKRFTVSEEERQKLHTEREQLTEERDGLRVDCTQLREERDRYRTEKERAVTERDELRESRDRYREERDQAREERQIAREAQIDLERERDRLLQRLEDQSEQLTAAQAELEQLREAVAEAEVEDEEELGEDTAPPAPRPEVARSGSKTARRGDSSSFGFGFGTPSTQPFWKR